MTSKQDSNSFSDDEDEVTEVKMETVKIAGESENMLEESMVFSFLSFKLNMSACEHLSYFFPKIMNQFYLLIMFYL